jgi:hypothetical protein
MRSIPTRSGYLLPGVVRHRQPGFYGPAGSAAFNCSQRHFVALFAIDHDDPDVTLQVRIDLAGGGIDIILHEIDGEFLAGRAGNANRDFTGSFVFFA